MGRPERPVDRTVPAVAALADFLRERKALANLTYTEMAAKTKGLPSAATLKRAASGVYVPEQSTLRAFVIATFTDSDWRNDHYRAVGRTADELWVRARRAARAPYYLDKAPDPTLISTRADLSRALRDLWVWSGCPSPLAMEQIAGTGELPHTTVRRIIEGRTLPASTHQAVGFLFVCRMIGPAPASEDENKHWIEALMRIGFSTEEEFIVASDKFLGNFEAKYPSGRPVVKSAA